MVSDKSCIELALDEALRKQSGTSDALVQLVQNPGWQTTLASTLMGLVVVAGNSFELVLTKQKGVVQKLLAAGHYEFVSPGITDEMYPLADTDVGVAVVRYRIVRGVEMGEAQTNLEVSQISSFFRQNGLRFPKPDEALLPPSVNSLLGGEGAEYVALLHNRPDAIVVYSRSAGRAVERGGSSGWATTNNYVGVYL